MSELPSAARQAGARRTRSPFLVVSAGLAIVVVILICAPLLGLVASAFLADGSFGGSAFAEAFALPNLVSTLVNTVIVIGSSTALAAVIGTGFAWLNERTDARMGWLTEMLPVVPLLVPPIAGAIGWLLLASEGAGLLNGAIRWLASLVGQDIGTRGPLDIASWPGLIFVYTIYLVPHVYLVVAAAFRNLDPSLEEAARTSGSSPARTFRTVTMPSVRPAIISGIFLAVVYAFALFSVPVIIGKQARIDVLAVRIVSLLTEQFPPRVDVAVVLGLILLVVIGALWFIQSRVLRSARFATISGKSGGQSRVALGRWRGWARTMMIGYVLVSAVLPFVALIIVSLQDYWSTTINVTAFDLESYERVLIDTESTKFALRNSILLGIAGATLAVILAAVLANLVRLGGRSPFARAIDGVTKLPGALSHIIVAMAFLAAFAGPPFRLHGTILLLLLAYLVLYLPQASVSAGSALAQIGPQLAEASLVSGAGPGRTFRRIQLPLMLPGLAAGWAFVFVLTAGDITASTILATDRNPVIGFVILDLFGSGTYPTLAALATIITIVSSVVVLTVLAWSRRRQRQR